MKIVCPKCGEPQWIDISNAIDEDGETFLCPHCKWKFRYVSN